MLGIPTRITHLFIYFPLFFYFFISFSLFFSFFFCNCGAHWPSLLRCPNNMKVKVSQGKFGMRRRDRNLGVQMRSNVCVCVCVHEFH